MKLTKNFTLEELIASDTAKRKGINNKPTERITANLKALCENILQPLRDKYGKSIIVSSGFRCYTLNKAVGGSKTSEHVYGYAADIRSVSDTLEDNKEIYDLIVSMKLPFNQLIWEFGSDKGPDWVHVSFSPRKKGEKLRAKKIKGQDVYVSI